MHLLCIVYSISLKSDMLCKRHRLIDIYKRSIHLPEQIAHRCVPVGGRRSAFRSRSVPGPLRSKISKSSHSAKYEVARNILSGDLKYKQGTGI